MLLPPITDEMLENLRPPQRHFVIGYERPALLEEHEADPHQGIDQALLREVGTYMVANYRHVAEAFRWRADHANGILTASMPRLMGDLNVFAIHTADIQSPSGFKFWIERAVGELLERYRVPANRRAYSHDVMREAIARIPAVGLHQLEVPE